MPNVDEAARLALQRRVDPATVHIEIAGRPRGEGLGAGGRRFTDGSRRLLDLAKGLVELSTIKGRQGLLEAMPHACGRVFGDAWGCQLVGGSSASP